MGPWVAITTTLPVTHERAMKSSDGSNSSENVAPFTPRLTDEQLQCLSRCAKGISVRFERWEIVDALVHGGYAEKGVAGVLTVTPKGLDYLRTHGG